MAERLREPRPTCDHEWPAEIESPCIENPGVHVCNRALGHSIVHRCECGAALFIGHAN